MRKSEYLTARRALSGAKSCLCLIAAQLVVGLALVMIPAHDNASAQQALEFSISQWGLLGDAPSSAGRIEVSGTQTLTAGLTGKRSIDVNGQPRNAFIYELDCRFGLARMRCDASSLSKAQLAVFILVSEHKVPPTGLRLKSEESQSGTATLADFSTLDPLYPGEVGRAIRSTRLGWLPIRRTVSDRSLLPLALVICAAPNHICNDARAVPINLVDVVGTNLQADPNEITGRAPMGAPPAGVVAQAPQPPSTGKQPQSLPGQRPPVRPPAAVPQQPPTNQTRNPGLPWPSTAPPPPAGELRGPNVPPASGVPTSAPPLPGPAAPTAGTEPPDPGAPSLVPDSEGIINLTIRGTPNEYGGRQVARLVISALAGAGRSSDVLSVRVDDVGEPRSGELKVKEPLLESLTIAGKSPVCIVQRYCYVDLELKEWVLYLDPLVDEELPQVRIVPWSQLSSAARSDPIFERIGGINGVSLPLKKLDAEFRPHTLIYLLDGSAFKLDSRDVRTAPVVTPVEAASRQVLLRPARSSAFRYELRFPPPGPNAGAQRPAAPPAHPVLHIVLDPREVAGWPPERVAERLRKILADTRVRAVVSAGSEEVQPENRQPVMVGLKAVVWRGELRDNWSARIEGLPRPFGQEHVGTVSQNSLSETRIGLNHRVAVMPITLPPVLLSDSWQFSIKAVNRIYGNDEPIQSNERCEFKLVNRANASPSVVSQLVTEGDVLRSTAVDASKLVDARLELEVTPTDRAGRCLHQSVPLSSVSWRVVDDTATVSASAALTPRGRWFLGLYAPQGIGGGIASHPSEQAILEARSQIIDSMVTWLEAARKRYFADADPSQAALGFDLALMSGADAMSGEPFEEASVIVGQYRQPKIVQFKLDRVGEGRLEAFYRSARGTGGPPSFEALERMIGRYSNLFGQLDPDGRAPIVVYVGGGVPNPDSCRDWAQMTRNVKPARVFALAFVSASAAAVRQGLGPDNSALPQNSGMRPLGYSCQGENESMLLFSPFPDLLARSPDLVLEGIFQRLDLWMARN